MVSQWWRFGKDIKADKNVKYIYYMYIYVHMKQICSKNPQTYDNWSLKKIQCLGHSDGQTVVEYASLLRGGCSFRARWLLSLVSGTLSSASLPLPSATVGSKDSRPDFLSKGKPMPLSCKELSIKSSSEECNDSSSSSKWLTMWIPSKGAWPEKTLWPFRHLSCQNKIQDNIFNLGKTHTPRKQMLHV